MTDSTVKDLKTSEEKTEVYVGPWDEAGGHFFFTKHAETLHKTLDGFSSIWLKTKVSKLCKSKDRRTF